MGCMSMNEREKVEGIVLIYSPTEDYLNERQRVAYKGHRERLVKWLAKRGTNPEKLEGYAYDTYTYANIIPQFHRYVWGKSVGSRLTLATRRQTTTLKD